MTVTKTTTATANHPAQDSHTEQPKSPKKRKPQKPQTKTVTDCKYQNTADIARTTGTNPQRCSDHHKHKPTGTTSTKSHYHTRRPATPPLAASPATCNNPNNKPLKATGQQTEQHWLALCRRFTSEMVLPLAGDDSASAHQCRYLSS